MLLTHCGATYECHVAVKCENDNYIKLYDANGMEIAAFHNISDFSEYEISNGDFISPCDCSFPVKLSAYSIGGRTIATSDWIQTTDAQKYYYEISNALISSNITTCNIMLFFAAGTEFAYEATQEQGKVVLYTENIPDSDIVIDSIQIIHA